MKTLELNQMEKVQGGLMDWTCLGFGLSGAGTILAIAGAVTATAAGPLGWAILGAVVGAGSTAATLIENGDSTC